MKIEVWILNTNTWIAIIKFGGQHASKFGIFPTMAAILDLITLIPPELLFDIIS